MQYPSDKNIIHSVAITVVSQSTPDAGASDRLAPDVSASGSPSHHRVFGVYTGAVPDRKYFVEFAGYPLGVDPPLAYETHGERWEGEIEVGPVMVLDPVESVDNQALRAIAKFEASAPATAFEPIRLRTDFRLVAQGHVWKDRKDMRDKPDNPGFRASVDIDVHIVP